MSEEHDRRMREAGAKLWADVYAAEFAAISAQRGPRAQPVDADGFVVGQGETHGRSIRAADRALAELVERFGSL